MEKNSIFRMEKNIQFLHTIMEERGGEGGFEYQEQEVNPSRIKSDKMENNKLAASSK